MLTLLRADGYDLFFSAGTTYQAGGQKGTTWLTHPMICTPGVTMESPANAELKVSLVEEWA